MENYSKIVDFTHCNQCKHKDLNEDEEPCFDCLATPVNVDSRMPIHYEKADEKRLL